MGGIALALATWLMTEKDMVVPLACMHACFVWNVLIRRVPLPVPIYTFSILKESLCIFYLFLKTFYIPVATCRMAVERGKRVYIGIVSVCE